MDLIYFIYTQEEKIYSNGQVVKKIEFLGKLVILFGRSKITYKQYIENNRSFTYAKILRETNTQLRNELIGKSYLLSHELRQEALKLINHYDFWLQRWDDLFSSDTFKLDDTFVFSNNCTFPKESEDKLIKEFSNSEKKRYENTIFF